VEATGSRQLIAAPDWQESAALATLGIERVAFDHHDGNCQGYALRNTVAINPMALYPHKTLLHELAHVVLGHTGEGGLADGETPARDLREVEAEATAHICLEALGLPGADHSRAHLQHWLAGRAIPDKSVNAIFSAADKILKAGQPQAEQKAA